MSMQYFTNINNNFKQSYRQLMHHLLKSHNTFFRPKGWIFQWKSLLFTSLSTPHKVILIQSPNLKSKVLNTLAFPQKSNNYSNVGMGVLICPHIFFSIQLLNLTNKWCHWETYLDILESIQPCCTCYDPKRIFFQQVCGSIKGAVTLMGSTTNVINVWFFMFQYQNLY